MSKATMLKAGGILVATCFTVACTLLPSTGWLTPEITHWSFLIAIIGVVIGGVMWLSGKKAQTASLSTRQKVVTWTIIAAVMAIITVGGLINMERVQENALVQEWQWSHPSPQEIFQNINASPPYLQETARQNYKELPVTWGVTLFSADDSPDGVRISATSSGQTILVMFTVDASLYPEMKTMLRGQEFVVQGTITEVSSLWIKLGDCHLIFH